MDPNGLYTLDWHIDQKDIVFTATANTRGFMGLGFSHRSEHMAGSDLVLVWVDDRTGKPNVLCPRARNEPRGDRSRLVIPVPVAVLKWNRTGGFQVSSNGGNPTRVPGSRQKVSFGRERKIPMAKKPGNCPLWLEVWHNVSTLAVSAVGVLP
uniref:DOMON domain-containing protein n=1 Tax=Anopheles merus TaxID=30066 RepID=A0A182V530_ANOME